MDKSDLLHLITDRSGIKLTFKIIKHMNESQKNTLKSIVSQLKNDCDIENVQKIKKLEKCLM